MFGPNVKDVLTESALFARVGYMDHRGHRFRDLMNRLRDAFSTTFHLQDFNLYFVTGSGTFVNEIVMSSLLGPCSVQYADARFGKALNDMTLLHGSTFNLDGTTFNPSITPQHMAYVAYETSISRLNATPCYNNKGEGDKQKGILFADMISAFPYYTIPDKVDVFTTVSSKQIGAYPVIGIIGVRKTLHSHKFFRTGRDGSCLDLRSYMLTGEDNQTPHTPAIPLYADLLETVLDFDPAEHRQKLDVRISNVLDACKPGWVVGLGPVITLIPSPELQELACAFDLYRSKAGYQIFTWAGTDGSYAALCRALSNVRKGKDWK